MCFGNLVAVHGVGELSQLGGQRADPLLDLVHLTGAFGAAAHQFIAARTRLRHNGFQFGGGLGTGFGNGGSDFGGLSARRLRAFGARPALTFGARGSAQRIRFAANRFRAFLGGAHGQPGLHLHGPCLGQCGGGFLAVTTGGFGARRAHAVVDLGFEFDAAQPFLEIGQRRDCLFATGFGFRALTGEPVDIGLGRARHLPEPAEAVVDHDESLIGFVQCEQGLIDGVLAVGLFGQRTG